MASRESALSLRPSTRSLAQAKANEAGSSTATNVAVDETILPVADAEEEETSDERIDLANNDLQQFEFDEQDSIKLAKLLQGRAVYY